MRTYVLTHLSDAVLLRDLNSIVTHERTVMADVLAHIAEVDVRRLYLPAGFSSMRDYCVGVLHFSLDAAYQRIQAARAAREFPAIFPAVAEGRLHLAAVRLLAPHLTPENVDGLLTEAAYKSKTDVELLVARRFPRTEVMALVQALPASPALQGDSLAPGQVECDTPGGVAGQSLMSLAPGQVAAATPRSQTKPLAPERFALQMTISKETYDKLQYVRELMSHRLPSADIPQGSTARSMRWSVSSRSRSSRRPISRRRARDARAPTRATFLQT